MKSLLCAPPPLRELILLIFSMDSLAASLREIGPR
jgi:hypothetical protein